MQVKSGWKLEIPRRGKLCSKCEEKLCSGMKLLSIVTEGESDELIRLDYCPVCAQEVEVPKGATHWNSKVPEKKKDSAFLDLSRDERALELFAELVNDETFLERGEMQGEAFVLALYLVRKKYLALRKEVKKSGIVLQIYEDLRTEAMITLPRPNLATLPIAELQEKLAARLKGEADEEKEEEPECSTTN